MEGVVYQDNDYSKSIIAEYYVVWNPDLVKMDEMAEIMAKHFENEAKYWKEVTACRKEVDSAVQ